MSTRKPTLSTLICFRCSYWRTCCFLAYNPSISSWSLRRLLYTNSPREGQGLMPLFLILFEQIGHNLMMESLPQHRESTLQCSTRKSYAHRQLCRVGRRNPGRWSKACRCLWLEGRSLLDYYSIFIWELRYDWAKVKISLMVIFSLTRWWDRLKEIDTRYHPNKMS